MTEKFTTSIDHDNSSSPDIKKGYWSRRHFLQAALAATVMVRSTDILVDNAQANNHVDIKLLNNFDTKDKFPDTATLVYPGLKMTWDESEASAKTLEPALHNVGQVARVGYSNLGFDEDELLDASITYLHRNRIENVNLVGISMGGIAVANLAPRFVEAGINVNAGFLYSSPTGAQDVIDRKSFDLAVIACKTGLTIPVAIRAAAELKERLANKNERSYGQIATQVWEQLAPESCSSKLIQDQTLYIDNGPRIDNNLGDIPFATFGNNTDSVIDFGTAQSSWVNLYPANVIATPYDTIDAYHGVAPWDPTIHRIVTTRALYDMNLMPEPKATVKYY